jgi:hypothetical protein
MALFTPRKASEFRLTIRLLMVTVCHFRRSFTRMFPAARVALPVGLVARAIRPAIQARRAILTQQLGRAEHLQAQRRALKPVWPKAPAPMPLQPRPSTLTAPAQRLKSVRPLPRDPVGHPAALSKAIKAQATARIPRVAASTLERNFFRAASRRPACIYVRSF